jgi:serine/threonine protein kinase
MEKVGNGITLQELMDATPGPSIVEWIWICYLVTKDLAAIHSRGFLHNDLKMDNVVINENPDGYDAVIIDHGNASHIEESIANATITSVCMRDQMHFLAPEIKEGMKCSPAGDV